MEETQKATSIPFITYSKQFQVNPEAIDFLSQFKGKLGVVSI